MKTMMKIEELKDTYLFYFPVSEKGHIKELGSFEDKVARIAGGFTTHYPARGGWVDRATGEIIRDDLAIVEASGSFSNAQKQILEGLFVGAGKKTNQDAVYLSLNGEAKIIKEIKD